MKKINVFINGKEQEIPESSTVQSVLNNMKLKSPLVVVEKNREIVQKEDYANNAVQEGDKLEIVGFFGGG